MCNAFEDDKVIALLIGVKIKKNIYYEFYELIIVKILFVSVFKN